jgi:hypothetical protein
VKRMQADGCRAGAIEDEKERFLKVATYYLSGWHIKPKG